MEDRRRRLLDGLEELNRELSQAASQGSNPCGQCMACCTAGGLTTQKVTRLELALLERHYGAQSAQDFADYAERKRGDDGAFQHAVCPNYRNGCQVYPHRPFSCRTFGHYRAVATGLPPECVFRGQELEFPAGDYHRVVPGAARLRALSRDFQLYFPHLPTEMVSPGGEGGELEFLNQEDRYDRAFTLFLEGSPQLAWEELQVPDPDPPLFADYLRALVAGTLDLHTEAYPAYRRLVEELPDRADFWTFAGYHAFVLGRFADAETSLVRGVELAPGQPLAWGFLGYLRLQQQRYAEAAEAFGQASAAAPDNPVYSQRLELARRMSEESKDSATGTPAE